MPAKWQSTRGFFSCFLHLCVIQFGYNLIRKLELDCQLTLTLLSNDPTEGFSSFFYNISSYDRLSYLTDWVNF
ncbi:hypothetical protein T08_14841 [Trichinella sp. T8]|nr:hypothetical protein T08_14841 [Trichinella sp. T8]